MSTDAREWVPLESGDRLTREEFHRRYCLRPDIKKAELIDGVVYVPFAVSIYHAKPDGILITWLGSYALITPGVEMLPNATVILEGDNEVQPDALLYRVPPPEGGARPGDDKFLHGPPQLVTETALSSASYDLHAKMRLYERSGVHEYLVWQVYENRFLWLRLSAGRYLHVEPGADGVIESEAFPGLRLNVVRLLAGDYAGAVAAHPNDPS
jgi:Uma2 family endonuclease